MTSQPRNTAASVRQRLLNLARARGEAFDAVLVRYVLERLLYRMAQSPHAERFVLKGALLFNLWFDLQQRPTRDADFLGLGSDDPAALADVFREIVSVVIPNVDDGLLFDVASLSAEAIRKAAGYPGVRVSMLATLDGARIPVQCDVGFGDVITPAATRQVYPVLLDLPAPEIATYPLETVVAEKLEAMVTLAGFNSRMKDFFDLWVLLSYEKLDRTVLPAAIGATFRRRGTPLPKALPAGLADEFARAKQSAWQAFLTRSALQAPALFEIIPFLRETCWPLLRAAADLKD